MIRIRTPSRLHFGLIAPAAKSGRRFGGAGLMIDKPGVEVTLEPAAEWRVRGQLAERGRTILERLLSSYLGTQLEPHEICIHTDAPEHMGLGTGTQLALAMARGLAEAAKVEDKTAIALAPLVGRGLRSAIGTHGFDRGGFLVDGGKADDEDVAPLAARLAFPEAWRIVLILPPWPQGIHGLEERQAFGELEETPGRADALCRLLLMEILPALAAEDFDAFSESLHDFNRQAGEAFAAIQGGPYANARVDELVQHLSELGVKGVGQSSWGPAVFAMAEDAERARWLVRKLVERFEFSSREMPVVAAAHEGARVSQT